MGVAWSRLLARIVNSILCTWNEGVEREAGDLRVLYEAEEKGAGLRVPDVDMFVPAAGHQAAAVSGEDEAGDPATVT